MVGFGRGGFAGGGFLGFFMMAVDLARFSHDGRVYVQIAYEFDFAVDFERVQGVCRGRECVGGGSARSEGVRVHRGKYNCNLTPLSYLNTSPIYMQINYYAIAGV